MASLLKLADAFLKKSVYINLDVIDVLQQKLEEELARIKQTMPGQMDGFEIKFNQNVFNIYLFTSMGDIEKIKAMKVKVGQALLVSPIAKEIGYRTNLHAIDPAIGEVE